MKHKMKLQEKYYDFIINGTKRIEIRLNDEKRQTIKLGDTIEFSKEPELKDKFDAKVIGLIIIKVLKICLKILTYQFLQINP